MSTDPVGDGEAAAIQPDEVDVAACCGDASRRQRPPSDKRVDRQHPADGLRQEGQVVAGTKADLQHLARQGRLAWDRMRLDSSVFISAFITRGKTRSA